MQDHEFQNRLCFEGELPLSWKRVDTDAAVFSVTPLDALETILLLEDARNEHEIEPGMMQELRRIDAKLDMLLAVMMRMSGNSGIAPRPTRVRFNASLMEWQCNDVPEAGELVRIELYLLPQYPFPVLFTGRVVGIGDPGDFATCKVEFIGHDDDTRAAVEKYIFRHHRRMVARQRM